MLDYPIRPFSADLVPTLKRATVTAIALIRNCEVAATYTRVQKTQLRGYANIHQPYIAPLDVALDLDNAASTYASHAPILTAYATALGYYAVPMCIGPGDFGRDMGEFAETSGDVLATAVRILADGRIDPHEAQEISGKLMQARQILDRALACVHTVQAQNQPYVVPDGEVPDDRGHDL